MVIRKIIELYKNCYLLSVKKGNRSTRHKKLKREILNIYKNFNLNKIYHLPFQKTIFSDINSFGSDNRMPLKLNNQLF